MRSLLDQLDHEWDHQLGHDRAIACRLPEVLDLTNTTTLDAARAWTHAAPPADADRVLVALVARAVEGDGLAARALLGWLTPGVRAMVRRWSTSADRVEVEAAAVASVYERICCYPLARRPSKIAANILLDAAIPLRAAACPRLVTTHLDHDVVDDSDDTPADELIGIVTDALRAGILDVDDARLVLLDRVAGTSMSTIADTSGVSRRTLERRRHRAVTALVDAGAEL